MTLGSRFRRQSGTSVSRLSIVVALLVCSFFVSGLRANVLAQDATPDASPVGAPCVAPDVPPAPTSLRDVERQQILAALEQTGWHRGKTAEILGISPSTLYRRLRDYNLERRS